MARAAAQPPVIPGLHAERLLGSGGFSDVFLYSQELPRRQVAVKVLALDEITAESRAAFVDEANLMAQLSAHPFIVTIYNAAVAADGRPFFVMEYCPGPSLSQQYRYRQFTVADVLRTGIRVTSAVATAHAAGILHRDIKPANVLTNAYGWPALADFGISSAVDADMTGDAEQGGSDRSLGLSIPWSPPEMFEDSPLADVRSDVYSLAATVYTLLAGRSPFEVPGQPNGSIDLIGRIERGAITPFDRGDVPNSLLTVLRRGMAARAEDRFPSAIDFGRSLQRVELELSYSPTTLDVPNLAPARPQARPADDDATRMRPVVTVRQPAPQPAKQPDGDDATIIRPSIPTVSAQTPPALGDETRLRQRPITPSLQPQVDTDDTRRKGPAAIGTSASRGEDAEERGAAASAPKRQRRRLVPVTLGAAAVLLVAGGVTASVLLGTTGEPEPTSSKSGAPIIITEVPTPVEKAITVADDGSSVTFEWSNPEPEDGDVFIWQRTEGAEQGQKHVSDTSTLTLDGLSGQDKVCVSVSISRQNGKTSTEPLEMCTS